MKFNIQFAYKNIFRFAIKSISQSLCWHKKVFTSALQCREGFAAVIKVSTLVEILLAKFKLPLENIVFAVWLTGTRAKMMHRNRLLRKIATANTLKRNRRCSILNWFQFSYL